jgi:O-antigen ligase/polysaccharide polymerase Wzy-like membrane protein
MTGSLIEPAGPEGIPSAPQTSAVPAREPTAERAGWALGGWQTVLPLLVVAILLVLATYWQGAFALEHWGPPAVFGMVALATVQITGGGAAVRNGWLRAALVGGWGLAAWLGLSMVWAESAAGAWESAARTALYATLFTLPVVIRPSPRGIQMLCKLVLIGIGVIALVTVVRLEVDGRGLFLAGRLDGPVGYRNATACLFALAFWPMVATAARRGGGRLVRSSSFGLAVLALGLAFLTQSRGMVIGLVLGGVVAVGLGPDRVRRAWMALVATGLVAAAANPLLTAYHGSDSGHGVATEGEIRHAATALVLVAVVGAVAALVVALIDNGLRAVSPRASMVRTWARLGLALVVVALAVGALIKVGDPVSYASTKLHDFRDLDAPTTTGATRLTSTGGQRYDLWRIATDEFADHPLLGVGGGSYAVGYYQHRRTDRNLDDPHSLLFKILDEGGAVGLGLAVAFLVGVFGTLASRWRRLTGDTRRLVSAVSAAAVVVLGQSLVDWMYLLPGVMGLAVFLLALAVARAVDDPTGPAPKRLPVWLRAGSGAALAVSAVLVLLLYLSDVYVSQARGQVGHSPLQVLDDARTASDIDPFSVTPLYLEAGALESLGRPAQARNALTHALDLEPRNFATLGLIGDLELRQRDPQAARMFYRRALQLNPRDEGLQRLARGAA